MASFTSSTVLCIAIISSMTWDVHEFCPGLCPDGWVPYGGRCFQYIATPSNWYDAESHCLSIGGNLASVHNEKDDKLLKALQKHLGYDGLYWIGLSDIHKEGSWVWTDGTPFKYENWGVDQPDYSGGKQHCVRANSWGGKWSDMPCNFSTWWVPSMCSLILL